MTSPFAGVAGAGAVEMPAVAALVERERRRGWLRSWAFWVILLALGAMLASLVLLLWPQFDQGRRRSAPPANDRMNTDSLPERGAPSADPWNAPRAPGSSPAEPDEPAAQVVPPPAEPPRDPALPPMLEEEEEDPLFDPADPADALGGDPAAGGPSSPTSSQPSAVYSAFLTDLVGSLCTRARQCRTPEPGVCTASPPTLPSRGWRCYTPSAAITCLRAVRQLPCDAVVFTSVLRVAACYHILMC